MEPDDTSKLLAAGTYHASQKKVNAAHLKEIETKWRRWASCLDEYNHVHEALSVGDMVSNDLYYHKGCYNDFYNAYYRYVFHQNDSSTEKDEQWLKSISFSKLCRICMKVNLNFLEPYIMPKN